MPCAQTCHQPITMMNEKLTMVGEFARLPGRLGAREGLEPNTFVSIATIVP